MKCIDPILCYNKDGKRSFRHFSLATPAFRLAHNEVFNCGKCIVCRKRRSVELAIRCVLHASLYKNNCFLTLTYDEKKEGYHNDFQYEDIQKFKKRLRRKVEPEKIQVFNVHEYGKNRKKHWHLVVFNHDFSDKTLFTVNGGTRLYTSKTLEGLWPFGFSTIGDVTEASAMYQAQYTQKDFKNGNVTNIYKSHSKHSGIGREYFLRHYGTILALGYCSVDGRKIALPRYFEKLAHKHYCHFYDQSAFFKTSSRLALYRPFKSGEENLEIANLFLQYYERKKTIIAELSQEWEKHIEPYIYGEKPDFLKAGENQLYDLKNRTNQGNF